MSALPWRATDRENWSGPGDNVQPKLFQHQVEGVDWLKAHRFGMLAFEMRLGKTRTVIEATQQLYAAGEIDRAIVVAPAPVRDEWYDPDLGQIAAYSNVPVNVSKYQSRTSDWRSGAGASLSWVVSNYEFVRRQERLEALLPFCTPSTVLVLDESLAVKTHTSLQTKACARLRRRCGRVWLLNGTPEGDSPGDAFGQYQMLDPLAPGLGGPRLKASCTLDCQNWWHFRARYGILGGFKGKQIVSWTNLEDLRARTSPHTLRRTMDEVFTELPKALEPVVITTALTDETWRIYKDMRQDALVWLNTNTHVSAQQAGTKVLRLAQITSGFLGGIITDPEAEENMTLAAFREVGTEKLDEVLGWLAERLQEDHAFKAVLWCRFRAEVERLAEQARVRFPGLPVGLLYGAQRPEDRKAALQLLHPRTAGPGPAVVVGTARTGGFGLNLAAADTMVYVSSDYSLVTRRQSSARILGPDQKRPASYFDIVATGPEGQHTVDHAVLKALRKKVDVAQWTAGDWARALKEE